MKKKSREGGGSTVLYYKMSSTMVCQVRKFFNSNDLKQSKNLTFIEVGNANSQHKCFGII